MLIRDLSYERKTECEREFIGLSGDELFELACQNEAIVICEVFIDHAHVNQVAHYYQFLAYAGLNS